MAESSTRSEQFVALLCARAFLRLWAHPSPIGKKGKELCDCLIVCGPHIIIVSVKEIDYRDTSHLTGRDRWTRAAIEQSVKQLGGAERWLHSADQIQRRDGRSITLPPREQRTYHRIAVSLGGRGEVSLPWGDFRNGFVHVLDEKGLAATFSELDTVTDFIAYLGAVESLVSLGVRPLFDRSGPEDLLAMYAENGPDLGIKRNGAVPDVVVIRDGIYRAWISSAERVERDQDLKSSYGWDNLIEHFAEDLLPDGLFDMHREKVTKDELALVAMALQPRGHRANLAEALGGFLGPDGATIASRFVVGANRTAFVFLAGDTADPYRRMMELVLRCHVVRCRRNDVDTVVGIATDRSQPGEVGHSSELVHMHVPVVSRDDVARADEIQRELGYFRSMKG